jgi:predicted HTH transcriptional regulator
MSEKVLKEVAAFINSEPTGILLIGVQDDGTLVGIEQEYATADSKKANWDGYALFLTNKLNDSLSGSNPERYYRIARHSVNGKIICSIRTTRADKQPVLAKGKLYIRAGTQSKELKNEDMVEYIRNWNT